MSDPNNGLEILKKDASALAAAYREAGGKGGDGHHHNHCPFCQDESGFMLGVSQHNGNAVFACYKAGCKAGPAGGKKTGGTIVDLVMLARGMDSKAACKWVVERYGNGSRESGSRESGVNDSGRQTAVRKQGKLHLDVGAALEAAKFTFVCRKKDGRPAFSSIELGATWKYTDARGEPKIIVARFNTVKTASGDKGKEFIPVHQDGNGWRVGLGSWGKERKCPLYRLPALEKALRE